MSNIVLIDNKDSFTYNLVYQLKAKSHKVIVFQNNIGISFLKKEIGKIKNPIIILSPGPGSPKKAGCILRLIKFYKGKIPIVGICLGHQAIIEEMGGEIVKIPEIIHGRSSLIFHDQKEMFKGIKMPFYGARYHSLVGKSIPKSLTINAYSKGINMGVRNNHKKICGFQFHPESILTTEGEKLLLNTIKWCNT